MTKKTKRVPTILTETVAYHKAPRRSGMTAELWWSGTRTFGMLRNLLSGDVLKLKGPKKSFELFGTEE